MGSESPLDGKTPLQFVPGIGPGRAPLFERLGLRRAIDLLFFFPRNYQDIAPWKSVLELEDGGRATVLGRVVDLDRRSSFDGRSILGVLLALEGGGYLRCVWFNQPFRHDQFPRGIRVLATGVVKATGVAFEIRHPETVILGDDEAPPAARPMPVYPLTEGLQQRHVAKAVAAVLPLSDAVEEALPEAIRQRIIPEALLPIAQALKTIHQPATLEEAQRARERFIFQELFVLQLALAMHRYAVQHAKPSPAIVATPQIHSRILKRFPFELTVNQLQVIEEVRRDMEKEIPMNRLIQGDVGAGKTAIAYYAMLNAVANRYQAALMVPTELLARQHFSKLQQQLRDSQVMIELLTGSLSSAVRRELLQRIALGTVDIVIGTQALIGEHVDFAKLGLLVIDEQHRFGVEQRAALRDSRLSPHYLVMTATPIPRTLAMTAFGDLDVSILRDRPPGQSAVTTYVSDIAHHDRWWRFVIEQVRSGRQAFVVAPRLDQGRAETSTNESAGEESLGAIQWYENLKNGPLADLRLALVHGRMDGEEKQQRLDDFATGKTDVLVATTVIEVGIDVPNAAVMTILDADRLGLAQLHQLRGRVGRGRFPGYVCLFPRADLDSNDRKRLEEFAASNDGFALAELDLRTRGPGELLGTRQSGLPPLKIADLARDEVWVFQARDIAGEVIDRDPTLTLPEHTLLRRQVVSKHGQALAISDVG
ncbi:MAG: ATP-dependent DNA helicase RecG [Planctomycetes bacterium]|nr:ATP-dependent DNA helicase RecG [Planctomycetota bacterium]